MASKFPRMGSEMISPPRLMFAQEGSTQAENKMKKSGRVSNPELTKMDSEQKRLLRQGRNSIGVANTGATSGAALLTEA